MLSFACVGWGQVYHIFLIQIASQSAQPWIFTCIELCKLQKLYRKQQSKDVKNSWCFSDDSNSIWRAVWKPGCHCWIWGFVIVYWDCIYGSSPFSSYLYWKKRGSSIILSGNQRHHLLSEQRIVKWNGNISVQGATNDIKKCFRYAEWKSQIFHSIFTYSLVALIDEIKPSVAFLLSSKLIFSQSSR